MTLETANFFLGLGTVALQLGSLALLALYIYDPKGSWANVVRLNALWLGFTVALAGTVTALYYSEVLSQAPCGLCWLQRMFLFPQVVIFGIAMIKRSKEIADYIIGLSIVGALIALYQHYLQMGGYDFFPCPATGTAADCGVRTMFEFGYITFPLVAFSGFLFIIVLMLFVRSNKS